MAPVGLIEDEDGAPLPVELQRTGRVYKALLTKVRTWRPANDGYTEQLADGLVVAIAPVLEPWLPSQNVVSRPARKSIRPTPFQASLLRLVGAGEGRVHRHPTTGIRSYYVSGVVQTTPMLRMFERGWVTIGSDEAAKAVSLTTAGTEALREFDSLDLA